MPLLRQSTVLTKKAIAPIVKGATKIYLRTLVMSIEYDQKLAAMAAKLLDNKGNSLAYQIESVRPYCRNQWRQISVTASVIDSSHIEVTSVNGINIEPTLVWFYDINPIADRLRLSDKEYVKLMNLASLPVPPLKRFGVGVGDWSEGFPTSNQIKQSQVISR